MTRLERIAAGLLAAAALAVPVSTPSLAAADTATGEAAKQAADTEAGPSTGDVPRGTAAAAGTSAAAAAPAATAAAAAAPGTSIVTAEQEQLLIDSPFVYISSTRKDGSPSRKAEIWFLWRDGSVWVGTRPDSWRAKRIRWKRPMATIWIGSPDGPAIRARGEIVSDPARHAMLGDAYAAKYPERWSKWEQSFRQGLANGERVLLRYVPVAEPAAR